MLVKEVWSKIIKDSRGEKTIEVSVKTKKGIFIASSPNGKSKGKNETPAYSSRGINWSLKLLRVLCQNFNGMNILFKNFEDLEAIEGYIKKFEGQNEKIGANSVLALETALLKAAAAENEKPLWEFIKGNKRKSMPILVGNCIGGGLHSKIKKPDFQEFLLISKNKNISKAVSNNLHAYFFVKRLLKEKDRTLFRKKTDENAWQTSLNEEEILDLLKEVADKFELHLGIDVAASTFFNSRRQSYLYENGWLIRNREEQIHYIQELIYKHNLFYTEDPIQEEDFQGFSKIKSRNLIVGDDLTATKLKRIEKAIDRKSINAVVIKPNQNGYLWEVSNIIKFCKEKKLKIILSHRSGETMDNSLADLAVGFEADFIKAGIYGKERLVKLKRLIEIDKE